MSDGGADRNAGSDLAKGNYAATWSVARRSDQRSGQASGSKARSSATEALVYVRISSPDLYCTCHAWRTRCPSTKIGERNHEAGSTLTAVAYSSRAPELYDLIRDLSKIEPTWTRKSKRLLRR